MDEITLTDPRIRRASELATQCHAGQTRKGDGIEPYIAHPIRVALYLAQAGMGPEVIAGALLHDTLEETPPEKRPEWLATLQKEMPRRVLELVQAVSDADPEAPWRERQEAYVRALRTAPLEALAIACADKLDNAIGLKKLLEREGPAGLRRFNVPFDAKLAYFKAVAGIAEQRWPVCPFLPSLEAAVEDLRNAGNTSR